MSTPTPPPRWRQCRWRSSGSTTTARRRRAARTTTTARWRISTATASDGVCPRRHSTRKQWSGHCFACAVNRRCVLWNRLNFGIILGFVALNQIKKTGQPGEGLAKAGIIIGFITWRSASSGSSSASRPETGLDNYSR